MITSRARRANSTLMLLMMMALTIVPLVSMFVTALHAPGSRPSGLAWPEDLHWGNFPLAWDQANVEVLLKSSALIILGVVPVSLMICTMAGFGLGHLKLPGGGALYVLILLGLAIPFESTVIPLYYQMQSLDLLNTRLAIVLPLIGLYVPFGVFWMRGHFANMPQALTDAARVDGAGGWRLFWHVHLPLAMPALTTLGLLQFINAWNQFLLAVVLVDDPTKRTMAGALGAFQGERSTDIVLLCAGALLIMTPTVIVFLILQRYFVRALLAGAVKG
ncbi:carbohydrate ABC transporter permease [Phytoactinopolyspora alkaliphila]|uniref:Carbohydrate ABC transporter permease n=1 Tax=Phytoactinopolyspora alkaliphila TaxID=1783498 RepID=A0A6N9YIA2_9ACTN|nr:carbohydrate ABC transporter permease [Phytoactinopolyspora alkaliphila]NED94628.1 carbohydrate ABC transporter permease [Phytoactinopolyspora alkaliphila]